VLYTHQKQKKAKTWQDGVLCIPATGNRAILYDDKKTKLDALYVKTEDITSGEQLESDRYLILVEQEKKTACNGNQNGELKSKATSSASHGSDLYFADCSKTAAPSLPMSSVRIGLKRRNTGFVPPRMVKHPKQDEEDTAVSLQLPPSSKQEQGLTLAQPLVSGRLDILNMYPSRRWNSAHSSSLSQDSKPDYSQDNFQKKTLAQDLQKKHVLVADLVNEGSNASLTEASCNVSPKQSSPWTLYGSGLSSTKFNSPVRQARPMDRPALSHPQSLNLISVPDSSHTFDHIPSECNGGVVKNYHRVGDVSISKESFNDSKNSHEVPIYQKRTASQIMALLGGQKTAKSSNLTSNSESRYLHIGHNSYNNVPKDESKNAHSNMYGQIRDPDKHVMKTLGKVSTDTERVLSNYISNKVSFDVLPNLDSGSVCEITNSCHNNLGSELIDDSFFKNSQQLYSKSDIPVQSRGDIVQFHSGNTDCDMIGNGSLYKEPLNKREVDTLRIETRNKYLELDSSPENPSQTVMEDVRDIINRNEDNSGKSINLHMSDSVYSNKEENVSDEIKLDIPEPMVTIDSVTVRCSQSDSFVNSNIDCLDESDHKENEHCENSETDAELISDGISPNETDDFTANFSITLSPLSQGADIESETESLPMCLIQRNETGLKEKTAQLNESLKIRLNLVDENDLIKDTLQVEHEFEAGNIFASNNLKSMQEFSTMNAQKSDSLKIEEEITEENSGILENITLVRNNKEENIKTSDRLRICSDLTAESTHISFSLKSENKAETEILEAGEIVRNEIKSEIQNISMSKNPGFDKKEAENIEICEIMRNGKDMEIQNIQLHTVSKSAPKFNIFGTENESECSAESYYVNCADNKFLKKDLETHLPKNKFEENGESQNVFKDDINPNDMEVYSQSKIILETDIQLETTVKGNNEPQNTLEVPVDQSGGSLTTVKGNNEPQNTLEVPVDQSGSSLSTAESQDCLFDSFEINSQSQINFDGNSHSDSIEEGNSQPNNNCKEQSKSSDDYLCEFTSSISYLDEDYTGNEGISAGIPNVNTKDDLTGLNQRPAVLEGLEFSQDSLKLFSTQSSVAGDILGKDFHMTKLFNNDTSMPDLTKECFPDIEDGHLQVKEIAVKNVADMISNVKDTFKPDQESGFVMHGFGYDSEKKYATETQFSEYTNESICSTSEVRSSLGDEKVYMKSSLCLQNEDFGKRTSCTIDDDTQLSSLSQNSWLAIGSQSCVQSVGVVPEFSGTSSPLTFESEMRVNPMDPLLKYKFPLESTIQSKETSFSDCISSQEISIISVSQDFANDSYRDIEVRRPANSGEELRHIYVSDTKDCKLSYPKRSATNTSDILYHQRAQKGDEANDPRCIYSDDRESTVSFIIKDPDLPLDPIEEQTEAVAKSSDVMQGKTGFPLWKEEDVHGPDAPFSQKQLHQQMRMQTNLEEKKKIQKRDNVYKLVTSLPHPSELLGSQSFAGGQRKITVKDNNITEKIVTQLEGYKMRGSISGVAAMRNTSNLSKDFLVFEPHQGFHIDPSPLSQSLDDVQSVSGSPSLFVDWNEGKPKFMEKSDTRKLQADELPLQHVPEQHFPSPRVSGDDENDDQIYQRIFQPRHLLSKDEVDGIKNSDTRSFHQRISEQVCPTQRNMNVSGSHDVNDESLDLAFKSQQEHFSLNANIFDHCRMSVDSRLSSPNLECVESPNLCFKSKKSHLPRYDEQFEHVESNFPGNEKLLQHFEINSSDEDAGFRFMKPKERHLERNPIVTTPFEGGAAIIVGNNDRISFKQPDSVVPSDSLCQEITFEVDKNGLDEEGESQPNTVCDRDNHSDETCIHAPDKNQLESALREKSGFQMQMYQSQILRGLHADDIINNNKRWDDFEFSSGFTEEQKSYFGKPITFHDSQVQCLEQNTKLKKPVLISGASSTNFDECPPKSEKNSVPGSRWGKYILEEPDDEVDFDSVIKEDMKASANVSSDCKSAFVRILSQRPEYFSGLDQNRLSKEDFRGKSDLDTSFDAELDSFNEDFLNSHPTDVQREELYYKDNLTQIFRKPCIFSKQTTPVINDFKTRTQRPLDFFTDSSRTLDVSDGKEENYTTPKGSYKMLLQGGLNSTLPQEGSKETLLQRGSDNTLLQGFSKNALPLVGSTCTLPQGSSKNTLPTKDSDDIFKQTEGRSEVMPKFAPNGQFRSPMLSHSPYDEQNREKGFPLKSPTLSTGSAKSFRNPLISNLSSRNSMAGTERSLTAELIFPSKSEVEHNSSLLREMRIPVSFPSVVVYKQVLTAAIKEHLNLQLFEVSKKYHYSLAKVDTSDYKLQDSVSVKAPKHGGKSFKQNPPCHCQTPSKLVQVKKEGPNKGRYFYSCSASRNQQCKFFQWVDGKSKGLGSQTNNKLHLSDAQSLMTYFRDHKVIFFSECIFLKRVRESIKHYFKGVPSWVRKDNSEQKPCMLIKLPKKDPSSFYSKDDLWIVSQHLEFDPNYTFLARSSYFGPNSNNEVEIEPLAGFLPSNWPKDVMCHAILAGNASTELGCLQNIQEHVQTNCPPVLPCLLYRDQAEARGTRYAGFKAPHMVISPLNRNAHVPEECVSSLTKEYIVKYKLNPDQAEAIRRVAAMFTVTDGSAESILLIHGVFGAGKSFLLSIAILFLVRLFEVSDSYSPGAPYPWKILISSTTNVAVDRILLGLLELGFDDFIRVGSIKKIAKPVLPYSVHATGTDSQELQELQNMLRSGDLTPAEKHHVKQSIDKHRLGENKKKLVRVRVVGVTCASCAFSCLDKMKFPFVLLDECSQMTEPTSLLPIARFECEKLILVGDPKQLDPTVQGSEAAHREGLEQTLFDRCMKMGYVPTMLRIQYRCHPKISAVSNHLFYSGQLKDGVTEEDREPVITEFPALCFIDVFNGQEVSDGVASYYNEAEAEMVVFLIEVLVNCRVDPASIGVITLYKSQMSKVLHFLHNSKHAVQKELRSILVSTVDAFQGGERDVIILSCVRTDFVGFIDNDKRTNVALTRAKKHLLIMGNYHMLSHNKLWKQIIQHCQALPGGIQKSTEVRSCLYYLHTSEEPTGSCLDSENPKQSISNKSYRDVTKKRRKRSKKEVLAQSPSGSELSISEIKDLTPSGNQDSSFKKRRIVENKSLISDQCSILSSPPMSLSDEDRLINTSSQLQNSSGIYLPSSQEGHSELSFMEETQKTRNLHARKPAKRMWKSDRLDPEGFCLETSDKENTDDELPSFDTNA
ncbi:hypothetical protein ACJMK2_035069, partial [Sinanodonta woodiana]